MEYYGNVGGVCSLGFDVVGLCGLWKGQFIDFVGVMVHKSVIQCPIFKRVMRTMSTKNSLSYFRLLHCPKWVIRLYITRAF